MDKVVTVAWQIVNDYERGGRSTHERIAERLQRALTSVPDKPSQVEKLRALVKDKREALTERDESIAANMDQDTGEPHGTWEDYDSHRFDMWEQSHSDLGVVLGALEEFLGVATK